MPHSYGLMPYLNKRLSKLQFLNDKSFIKYCFVYLTECFKFILKGSHRNTFSLSNHVKVLQSLLQVYMLFHCTALNNIMSTYIKMMRVSTHTRTHTQIRAHTHICVCVCVCVCDNFYKKKIIIIIMSHCQHGFPWPSLTIRHYRPPLSGDLPGYILYRHRAVVYRF